MKSQIKLKDNKIKSLIDQIDELKAKLETSQHLSNKYNEIQKLFDNSEQNLKQMKRKNEELQS